MLSREDCGDGAAAGLYLVLKSFGYVVFRRDKPVSEIELRNICKIVLDGSVG